MTDPIKAADDTAPAPDTRKKPDALANDASLSTIRKDEPAKPAPVIADEAVILRGINEEPSTSVDDASEILQSTANSSTPEKGDVTLPANARPENGSGGRYIAQPGGLVVRAED
jgi:hypothetical protein